MNRRSNYTSVAGGLLVFLLAMLAISTSAFAQLPGVGGVPAYAPPFDTVGFIQSAGLGPVGGRATYSINNRTQGGWVVVNNHTIVVPQNVILQMPATQLTWADLFDPAGPSAVGPSGPAATPYGGDVTASGTRTGMAMDDPTHLAGTYEIHVQGNIVNGTYIAGLIFIAPQSLNAANGYIMSIDYTNGDLYVSGGPGGTLTKVEVNDPIGRFGLAHSPDQRFTIDEDNPTIHAETGYPMCVPRYDPAVRIDNLCPQINRPTNPLGGYLMNFTMPDPLVRRATDPDAFLMAPFEVGDYITYAGMLVPDSTQPAGYYISAYNIDNNVGIYTAPNADPVYVVMGEFEQGTGGAANVAFPQETTSRVKVEGMMTDSDVARTAMITARDTDCNGLVRDRQPAWMPALPIDPGPPTGAKRGRIRWRPNGGPFLPPAKEIHVIANNANTEVPTKNGLFPGQYFAPEFSFIFPENLGVGDPPVTLNFIDFPWLTDGIGPFGVDGAGNPVVVGQLNPWPDMVPPATTGCAYNPAIANAVVTADAGGPYQIQLSAAGSGSVALTGNASVPAGATAQFAWTILNQQPAGSPQLLLNGSATGSTAQSPTASISGLATLTTPMTFQLSLVASNAADPLHPSTASVATLTVLPPAQPPVISSFTLTPSTVDVNNAFTATVAAFDPGGLALTYTYSAPANCATLTAAPLPTATTASFKAAGSAITCLVSVTASNGAAATTKTATLVVKAVAGAPTIGTMTANPNPVASNGSVSLSAAVTDPNNLAMTYLWTVLNQATGTSFTLSGTNPTFTAPTVTFAQKSVNLLVSLQVTNSNGQVTTKANGLTIQVTAPPSDVLTNNGTLYRTSKSRLTVNVLSSVVSPSIVLTATLDIKNPATGQNWTATMQNLGGGAYTIDFIGVGLPNTINVVSTGGGTLQITQAQIAVRQ